MQITRKNSTPTQVKLTITADTELLSSVKKQVLQELAKQVSITGFRPGKAPLSVVEKNVDQNALQSRFLDDALNRLYVQAITDEKLRPVSQPRVSVTKFVPYSTLDVDIEVETVGELKLPDYKKFKLAKPSVSVSDKDVDDVIENLATRGADTTDVDRAAKDGDQVVIDFKGVDAKTKEPINGADGEAYPLVLGSNTFIPGFEPELLGMKAGEEKTFTVTFPKDYGVSALQSRKVEFTVTVQKVQEVAKPKIDDKFAASVGPFKTVADLKADIKRQLQVEREEESRRQYESELLEKLAEKTQVEIPKALIDEEIERQEADERRNLTYRGQTWQEHLKEEGVSEEEHREKQRPGAELRVKAGLLLSEVAEKEGLTVTPEELEMRMQLLRGQYTDKSMQAELDKPEVRRDIASRMLSEKTIGKLSDYATSK